MKKLTLELFIFFIFITILVIGSDSPITEKSHESGRNKTTNEAMIVKTAEKQEKEQISRETVENQQYFVEMLPRTVINPKYTNQLSLTNEQIKSLKSEFDKIKAETNKLKAELNKSGIYQLKLLTAKKVDEKNLMIAIEKTGKIATEIAKLQVKPVLVVMNTLKPEQIETAKKIIQEQAQKRPKAPASSEAQPKNKEREEKEKSKKDSIPEKNVDLKSEKPE